METAISFLGYIYFYPSRTTGEEKTESSGSSGGLNYKWAPTSKFPRYWDTVSSKSSALPTFWYWGYELLHHRIAIISLWIICLRKYWLCYLFTYMDGVVIDSSFASLPTITHIISDWYIMTTTLSLKIGNVDINLWYANQCPRVRLRLYLLQKEDEWLNRKQGCNKNNNLIHISYILPTPYPYHRYTTTGTSCVRESMSLLKKVEALFRQHTCTPGVFCPFYSSAAFSVPQVLSCFYSIDLYLRWWWHSLLNHHHQLAVIFQTVLAT